MKVRTSWIVPLLLLMSCAADPNLGESPGACKIDCNNTKIASNEMRVRFLSPTQVAVNCYGKKDSAYPLAIPVLFVVEKRSPALPAAGGDTTSTGTTAGTGSTGTTPVPGDDWQPVSGISFHPLLLQGQGGVDNEDKRDRFQGVVTPPESWCTDSCGVGTIEVKPICRSAVNDIKLGILSGSLAETVGITVNP